MKIFRLLILYMLFFVGNWGSAQTVMEEVQAQSKKLEKALDSNDEAAQAESYFKIGESFFKDGNYVKSEEYFQKAKNIYKQENNKKKLEQVTRKLAQAQEKQNKILPAITNYGQAAKVSYSSEGRAMNTNDVERLKSSSQTVKAEAIQNNMQLNLVEKENAGLAENYSQLADINIQQKDIPKAEENLNNAYRISKKETPQQALEINNKLTDLYVENKKFDKAIEAKKKVLKEDFLKEDSEKKVEQIQQLADIYIKKEDPKEAVNLLANAYGIAIEKGYTLEAQKAVKKLDSLYGISGKTDESVKLYRDFLGKLPDLISKDRSLVDNKILADTEQRIVQLEKEKELKDQLIQRKNTFNYGLIAVLIILLLLIGFIIWTLRRVQIKNKKIALQSLRREMNPHFIFNSLNSVNQFIASNNELEANQYLTRFSKLMRGVMENSTEDFIPLQQELDMLHNYLALEKTRFTDKFDYEVEVDESLMISNLQIPGMLIQPFLENAIWHGLRYRSEKGFLKLSFEKEQQYLKVTIEDNGIGIEESRKQKTEHQKARGGRGMKNTLERIKLLNDLYKKEITYSLTDKPEGKGVIIIIKIDLNLK
ncbi:tetratricopeptide repeat-containing sensor histidine kinase [Chryseobacterium sp. CT-SW4]|uniref:tetratricopeptide repeat-containing sensor histidine kinase n=1 Tax=Chryseobacterium sp. SW-1 TaxID=3157343 RepID=UPI003B023879